MCLRPKSWFTKDGECITIACQECRQCLDLKTHDWVGRNIAESKTSRKAHAVTLTYGRDENGNEDHPRAKVLTYSDVQKWFKLLRYHGYPCRYFLSGEYGPLKGRCHWHFIVYWLDRVPQWSGFDSNGRWSDNHMSRGLYKVRFNHRRLDAHGQPAFNKGEPSFWWPHGWTEVSEGATVDAIRYVCKYIRKDIDKGKQSQFMMSKNPPLGAAYFQQRAERYVAAGLAPQGGMGYLDGALHHGMGGYKYSWSDVTYRDKSGATKAREFQLRGASLDLFLSHYCAVWEGVWPGVHMPRSMLIEDWLDPGAWKRAPASVPAREMRRAAPITEEQRHSHLESIRSGRFGVARDYSEQFFEDPKRSKSQLDYDFEKLRPEFEARAAQLVRARFDGGDAWQEWRRSYGKTK